MIDPKQAYTAKEKNALAKELKQQMDEAIAQRDSYREAADAGDPEAKEQYDAYNAKWRELYQDYHNLTMCPVKPDPTVPADKDPDLSDWIPDHGNTDKNNDNDDNDDPLAEKDEPAKTMSDREIEERKKDIETMAQGLDSYHEAFQKMIDDGHEEASALLQTSDELISNLTDEYNNVGKPKVISGSLADGTASTETKMTTEEWNNAKANNEQCEQQRLSAVEQIKNLIKNYEDNRKAAEAGDTIALENQKTTIEMIQQKLANVKNNTENMVYINQTHGYDNQSSSSGESESSEPKKEWHERELDKTPIYVPYVASYGRKKTADGLVENESATLKRYYSSIDAELYFGNEYVEDICDIQWQLQQNHLPIFGYNSYMADDIAIGSRIVQGTFSIRFTSPNYLFKILEAAKEEQVMFMNSYKIAPHDRVLGEAEGAKDENLKGVVSGTKHKELWPETFDIDIVYGKPARGSRDVHVFLTGVRILSCVSGASASSPVPVTEVYQFVAKDIKTLA